MKNNPHHDFAMLLFLLMLAGLLVYGCTKCHCDDIAKREHAKEVQRNK